MESVIFNVGEIYKVNFSEVTQTLETLVYSVNKVQTYVTWTTLEVPSFVSTLNTAQGIYDNNQLLSILETHDWLIIT
jgi:ABC-type polysaccharide transport system permease subunit